MKKIMIISGAGLSAESGIHTFKDHDGLWENHDVMKSAYARLDIRSKICNPFLQRPQT